MSHYAADAKYQEMAPGGIIPQAGNAVEYNTGGWRLQKPHRRDEDCIDCLFCWVYCPDASCWTNGDAEKPSVKGMQFDMEHCKGCAICAQVCPKKAIDMLPEGSE